MKDLLENLTQDMWHTSYTTGINNEQGSYGRAWQFLVQLLEKGYVDSPQKYIKFKQLYNRINSYAVIKSAYLNGKKGHMEDAHSLYWAMERNPQWFWRVTESIGKDAYRFFWNLYHPDDPIE